jgi:nucleotide-binding universal stress UspA family protein
MFQQIMVPLDGSELAERALPCAERLCVATGATLHLVHVVELAPPLTGPFASAYVPSSVYDDLVAQDTQHATAYLDKMRERVAAGGLHVRTEQMVGYAAVALLDYERDARIDLVVMCSHGRSGLARFALGSVADRLLHHGTAPVLLVRPFGAPVTLQHAVVPLDGSERAEEALRVVDQLAHDVVHEVTLLRVIGAAEEGPEADRYLDEVARRLTQEHLACRRRVEQGDPAETIIDVAGTDKLVVMATRGRSGLLRWALGSVADRVARGGAAAVLLVRAGAQTGPRATPAGRAP